MLIDFGARRTIRHLSNIVTERPRRTALICCVVFTGPAVGGDLVGPLAAERGEEIVRLQHFI